MLPFAYALCNPGSEGLLCDEVARVAPGVAAAYRRRGLLTFRLTPELDALPALIFARVHGASLGLARDPEEVLARAAGLERPLRLHVAPRDDGDMVGVEAALRARGEFLDGLEARPGERVLDVVVGDAGEALLAGTRVQGQGWRSPGGRLGMALPPEAPSRAYLKLEEALAWSGLAPLPGETAVELGSAPGGAAHALVARGVNVVGVDPAAMDPRVLALRGPGDARVTHLPLEVGALRRRHLPRAASLLLCDVNLAPPVALRAVASCASWLRGSLRAVILTLKLNDARMVAAIPNLLERVAALGLSVRATQLPANRKEMCVVGTR